MVLCRSLAVFAVAALAAIPALAQDKPAPATDAAKTGDFEVTFTERSPLSAPAVLQKRLSLKETPADYDIAKEPYRVYVPANYDPTTPHALMVFLGYKNTGQAPTTLQGIMDREHIVFVGPCNHGLPDPTRAAQAVDAVFNMSKRYNVDPNRIWFFGSEDGTVPVGLGYPDVFSGVMVCQWLKTWRPLKAPNGAVYPAEIPAPPAEQLTRAKSRRWVLGLSKDQQAWENIKLLLGVMKRDGFNYAVVTTDMHEDFHYPNLRAEWFEQIVDAFNVAPPPGRSAPAIGAADTPTAGATAMTPAASAPAKPATSDATKQLSLAQSYIASGAYKPARTKLNAIVEKYPDDPAAAEAKKLLEQINGK